MAMNLGELLAEQEKARKENKPVIPVRAKAKWRYERDKGVAFLNYVKNLFIEQVEANEVFKPVPIPREMRFDVGLFGFDDGRHPANDAFVEDFVPWAKDEGLRFVFKEQHDGGGMESWIEVDLRPL